MAAGIFAELAAPAKRSGLRCFGRKSSFFEAIEDEAVFESEVQVVLKRAFEIDLRLWLVSQCQSAGGVGSHIPRDFHGVNSFNLAIVNFFDDMHGGGVVETGMGDGEDEGTAGFEQFGQCPK